MEDIFELIIYGLVLLASAVGGIYKNYANKKANERKKQREANQPQSAPADPWAEDEPETAPPTSFEEFIRRQLEDEPVVTPEKKAPLTVQEQKAKVTEKEHASQSEGIAAFESTSQTLISDDVYLDKVIQSAEYSDPDEINDMAIYDTEASALPGFVDEFDAKQAVIYSEILKRPEY